MSCEHVHELISGLLDRRLDAEAEGVVLDHMEQCRPCYDKFHAYQRLRAGLQTTSSVPVPPRLVAQLQILASKERARRILRQNTAGWLGQWWSWARLAMDNMMRPLALPFAGGVLSALVLFSSVMPSLAVHKNISNDVPIALFTDPSLEEIGHSYPSQDDTVLHLTIDDRGRISDVVSSHGKLTPEMENDLLFYRFAPATAFGYPTWGRAIITFRRLANGSHIVVRG